MSEQLTIVCPHCAFSRMVPRGAIPAGATRATCPRCGSSFSLSDDGGGERPLRDSLRDALPQEPPASTATGEGGTPPREPVIVPGPPSPPPRLNPGFSFHGTAREYFGIWIVNTLLKILTVGIYSAWAKVRRRRFFFGSTTLYGQQFEYLADPMALFRGWLIAAAAFVLYSIGTRISPILSMVVALIVYAAFPWLVVRSRIFNCHNSSYRNIRFAFRPEYRQAYFVFAALPLLTVLSLGLLAPYMIYRQKKFMVENSSYGSLPFCFSAKARDFYILSCKIALAFIAVFILVGMALAMSGIYAAGSSGRLALQGMAALPLLSFPVVYFILVVYAQTAMANLCWNATMLGSGSFRSTLRTRDMALLFVTNAMAILFSLGLMVPWATVRLARYRFRHLELEAVGGLDEVMAVASSGPSVGAAGEEIGDLFNMPIDIAM